jgi:hypothetical protein
MSECEIKNSFISQNNTVLYMLGEHKNVQPTNIFKKSMVSQKIVDELQQGLDADILRDGLSSGNLLYLVANLMQTAGKYKKITGKDKKKIVVFLINNAIETRIENKVLEHFLQNMVTDVVPDVIDLLVDVSKKKYKFKSISKLLSNCCLHT